ncbi:MAG: porin family protein [Bacteroidia bacterium]|nr:porin family protein [Bacteroidia bacterium]
MKKLIFMIVAITAIVYQSSAQEYSIDSRSNLQFGFKMGVNYSNVYDTKGDAFNTDPKIGFATGTFIAIPIGRFLGIQPEILFSQKGFRGTGVILGSTYDLTRTTSYIDVPLLFSVKPVGFLTLLAGPQYSYLLKQKDVFANASTSIVQEQEFENDNIRRNTLCFLGGLDLNIFRFVLSGRVGWDILNNNGNGTSTTPRYKNVWYQFTLGFRLYN